MRRKEYEAAAAAYAEAAGLAPSFADVQARLGQSLLELGRVEEAAAAFQRAVASAPSFAAGHAMIGVALRRLGDEEAAKSAFQAAVALDPTEPIARFELGRLPS